MRPFAFFLLATFASGCVKPKAVDPPRIQTYSPADLIRDCRDGKLREGARVFVVLNPQSYKVVAGAVRYYVEKTDQPPTITWTYFPVPPDNSRSLEITGTIKSIDHDDTDRGSGIRFCINFRDCSAVSR